MIPMKDVMDPDVFVAGAGPAGTSIARLLALRGKRVTVIDPALRRPDRLEMISPSAVSVIHALDLSSVLRDPDIARPCLGIRRRWGTTRIDTDDFLCRPGGVGFVIDRADFDARLRTMAADAGVRFLAGRITAARFDEEEVVARVANPEAAFTIRANIAVDATGRSSVLARRLGAKRLRSDRLIADRMSVDQLQNSCRSPTWLDIEGQDRCWSYRMSGPNGRQENWTVYRDNGLLDRRPGTRVDASSARLSHTAATHWIAIGDAAVSFDPITSQGLVNALTTSLVVAGAILSSRGLDRDACLTYSDAVAATFHNSEVGRAAVYRTLHMRRARPFPGVAER
jgi:flavin-dependent dehydrogenase